MTLPRRRILLSGNSRSCRPSRLRGRRPHAARPCRIAAAAASVPELYLEARGAAADRLVQDPRRLQRRPPADAAQLKDGVWTVSAGNAAQGVALAARKVGARCSVMVMDTAPETKLRAIERLGATIVARHLRRSWQTVESHRSDRMSGHFVHPFDDDRFIAGNATAGLEILEDLPDVDAIVAPLGGGGLLAGIAAVTQRAEAVDEGIRRGARNRGAAVDFARGRRAALLRRLDRVVRRRRRRQVGARDDVAAAADARRIDRRVARRGRARHEARRRARAHHRGRRGGLRRSPPRSADAPARGKVVAVVSGGNIDLAEVRRARRRMR